jgi:hypothetical protein
MVEKNIDKINRFFTDTNRTNKTFKEILSKEISMSDLKIMSSLRDIETNTYIKL